MNVADDDGLARQRGSGGAKARAPQRALILKVHERSVHATFSRERREEHGNVVLPRKEIEVCPNPLPRRARRGEQGAVRNERHEHRPGLLHRGHDAGREFGGPRTQRPVAGDDDDQQVAVHQKELFFFFEANPDDHRLKFRVPVLVEGVAFDAWFFRGGERDFNQAPRLVVNDQQVPVEQESVGKHLRGRVTERAARDRNLDWQHLHLARPDRELAFARHGNRPVGGAGRVLKRHLETLLGVRVFAHEDDGARPARALGNADGLVRGLRHALEPLGPRQHRAEYAEGLANTSRGVVLFPEAAGLADGRGIVVSGGQRFRGPIKIRPAEAHVAVEIGDAVLDDRLGQEVKLRPVHSVLLDRKFPTELAEPAALEFGHAEGRFRLFLAQLLKGGRDLFGDVPARVKVAGVQDARHVRVGVFARGLRPAGDERDVDAGVPGHAVERAQVLALFRLGHRSPVVVFVFELDQDDRPAPRHQVALDDRQDLTEPVLRRPDALGVVRAEGKALRRDPPGKPAALPLCADVRARAHDHPEAHLPRELDERLKFTQVGAPLFGLVVVPEDAGLNRIEAGALELQHAVPPERPRTARVMERRAEDKRVAVVDGETTRVVADEARALEEVLRLGREERARNPGSGPAQRCGERHSQRRFDKSSAG